MMLKAIADQDVHSGSDGLRFGRSAHQALGALWKELMPNGGRMLDPGGGLRSVIDHRVTASSPLDDAAWPGHREDAEGLRTLPDAMKRATTTFLSPIPIGVLA